MALGTVLDTCGGHPLPSQPESILGSREVSCPDPLVLLPGNPCSRKHCFPLQPRASTASEAHPSSHGLCLLLRSPPGSSPAFPCICLLHGLGVSLGIPATVRLHFQDPAFSIQHWPYLLSLVPCRPCPSPAVSAEELLLCRAVSGHCCPDALSSPGPAVGRSVSPRCSCPAPPQLS